MANQSLPVSRSSILTYFEWSEHRVWSQIELERLLKEKRQEWQIRSKVGPKAFVASLVGEAILAQYELSFPQPVTRYCQGLCSVFELAMSIRPSAYLSHQGAMYLHGLIGTPPATVYVNAEQPGTGKSGGQLHQDRIDAAFHRPPRISKSRANYQNAEICLISGKNTNQLGVVEALHPRYGRIRFTGLERTLIDIAVRPSCSVEKLVNDG